MYEEAINQIQKILNDSSDQSVKKVVDYLEAYFDHYTWVGVYIVKKDKLYLGPWAGPQATDHIEISIGQGICGAAAKSGKIENIEDVRSDNRYLSCFVSTRSEIVVPISLKNKIIGEIDIDSDKPNAFDKNDETFLKKVADMLAEHIR